MGARATRLSFAAVNNAKAKEKDYVLSDGAGLQLRVRRTNSKQWNFNYTHPVTKKRCNIGLGMFPTISLAEAREAADICRDQVQRGLDPKEERAKKQHVEQNAVHHTVYSLTQEWFEVKRSAISVDYAQDVWRSFEMHVFPKIAHVQVKEISAPDVIGILRPLEAKGNLETVKRIVQRLNEVMTFGVNCGYLMVNPLSDIRAAFRSPKKQRMPALASNELPELMHRLNYASINICTRCMIEFQLHTMTRPNETSEARWEEIDFVNRMWIIPAYRMKMKREHRVPLTEQSLKILQHMQTISRNSEFIFVSPRYNNQPANSQTANMALKRMGFKGRLVSHGLRALASTTLNEQGFEPDLIEAALAHVDSNQVRTAYNRTDFYKRRIPMMEWWSQHIVNASTESLTIGVKRFESCF